MALKDCGSLGCVALLEGVLYEIGPAVQTAKVVGELENGIQQTLPTGDLNDALHGLERRLDIEIGEMLASAVDAIEKRNRPPYDDRAKASKTDPFARARELSAFAAKHLEEKDYGASLNHSRKALEAVLKITIKELGLVVDKPDPLEKLQLPALSAAINSNLPNLDKEIRRAIKEVQDESTYGSHDQGGSPAAFSTRAITQATIDKYATVERALVKLVADHRSKG
jgi:hypothetical protein